MKDNQFDHIISNKLGSLRANGNHSDWATLQSKMNLDIQSSTQSDIQSDQDFDLSIEGKLSSLKANAAQSDWDALQSKIEMDLQSDTQFDSTISEKVAQFSTGTNSTPDWENFSQILNQTGEFDQTIKQKLTQIPATQVSEHWLLLQERLQGIRNLKESILKLKFGESLLMMSLLLCFMSLSDYILPSYQGTDDILAVQPQIIDFNKEKKTVDSSPLTAQPSLKHDLSQSDVNHPISKEELSEDEISKEGSNREVGAESTTEVGKYHAQYSPHTGRSTSPQLVESENNNSDTQLLAQVTVPNRLIGSSEDVSALVNTAPIANGPSTSTLSPATPLLSNENQKSQNLSTGVDETTLSYGIPLDHERSEDKQSLIAQSVEAAGQREPNSHSGRFAFHTLVGVGIDQINTPGDEVFEFVGYQHYAANSDVGVRLSYDINNWSFETGISVLHKGYKPKYIQDTIRVLNQAVVQSLETIEFEFISVPLTVRRAFPISDDLSIYGLVGLEYLNVVSEQYNVEETNTDLPQLGEDLGLVGSLEYYKQNARVVNNHSMNYTAGLGLIKSINPLVSVYGQAVYRGQFSDTSGIGLNEDRFNSLSLQAGIKLMLAKKN